MHNRSNIFRNITLSNAIITLILILILAVIIRIPNLPKTIAFGEYVQTKAVLNHNSLGLDKGTEMPPLTTWTRIFFASIFGETAIVLKIVSLIFGIMTAILVYLLASELYDKKVAIWSVLLLAISAWHVLGSTSISFDGAFLTFYFTLVIYLYVKYIHTEKKLWLIAAGVAFGLAMLTKLNAILLIPILFIHSYIFRYRYIKRGALVFFREFFTIGLFAILVFSLFPIAALLTDWSYFTVVTSHTSVFSNSSLNFLLLGIQYLHAFIWIGPLYFGLYVLSLVRLWNNKDKNIKKKNKTDHGKNNENKKDYLMHIWVIVVFLFFTFGVQENFRPLERYFFVMFPAICILGANVINDHLHDLKNAKKTLLIFLSIFLLFSVLIYALNLMHNDILQFYPKTNFANAVVSGNWMFLVPFTGDQGPIGVYVSFASIALAFGVSMIIIAIMLFKPGKRKSKSFSLILFILFLAVALSFNMFMIQEQAFSLTNPNIDFSSKRVLAYALSHDLKEPILIFRNYALQHYLESRYSLLDRLDFHNENTFSLEDSLPSGGSMIFVDFPKMNEQSALWNQSHQCKLLYKEESAYIVEC